MDANYTRALDLTLQYLETQKAQGVRYLRVDATTLSALKQAVPPAPRAAPAPVAKPAHPAQPAPSPLQVVSPAPAATLSREQKEAAITELRARALACRKCPNLAAARTHDVFGVGDIQSP
jgi:hypothetical protein